MPNSKADLVFGALGGLGEIGMNCALYGYGPPHRRKWLMVDLGVSFAGPDLPGVDLVMPDLQFVDRIRKDIVALIITHAHEDHIGALADLWPRLGCPVYATAFAIGLAQTRRLAEVGAPPILFVEAKVGEIIDLAPFTVEYVAVAHSIPEGNALAIRTPLGTVLHSGDWKLDPQPVVGAPTDEARLKAIGDEGVLALVCDSTNILREGESPSEADVAVALKQLIEEAPGRVLVTTFASNVARIRSVAEAAQAAGREVLCVGRAMDRAVEVARECGYLPGVREFLPPDAFDRLPRERVVCIATGSQGEPRAAMSRMALDEHPEITLTPGDRVIFSSRTIPGNEKAVGRIVNALIDQGVEVITDRTHLVHVSGHPRRGEVAKFYQWVRPKIAVPAHGEALHLSEHRAFAASLGVPHVMHARDGDLVRLAPGEPHIVDQMPAGRLYKDGDLLVAAADDVVRQRQKLAFAGVVSVAVAITAKGDVAGDPDVTFMGLPQRSREGAAMDEIVDKAVFQTLDGLPRGKRRDADTLAGAIERAVRAAVNAAWGKKPVVHVLVVEV
ncbi:MAG: ribonuclease J [Methylobacteriaceae bacterium]|nr:ribonuclease J [Methylobacteriaceae bacterium]